MYQAIQYIRYKMPFIWNFIELANALSFKLLFGRKLSAISKTLSKFNKESIIYSLADIDDVESLAELFQRQPEDAFKYFKPHKFDKGTIRKLINNPAFIIILAKNNSTVVGYAFLRCFANGKAFRGKLVDIEFRGRGIAKNFGIITTEIASTLGIKLFGTISKSNISSMASSKSSNEVRVIEELPDNYLLIQYLPKQKV